MRVIVLTLAVLSALAGALLVGHENVADSDTEASDIALFV